MNNLTIEPLKGYGDIRFGMSVDEIVNIFGEPSNHEEMEPLAEGVENVSVLYDYDDEDFSLYFEGVSSYVVASISTRNEDAMLFGERIYDMSRNEIVDMMKDNGYKEFEIE